ncbi:MAG: VTT domain-containing protein [Roseiflexaceae bacterium]|nr:VTT domain-containing protein [Roseiflexaceae bacterium]
MIKSILTWLTPKRMLILATLILVVGGGLLLLRSAGASLDPASVRLFLNSLGPWGPIVLVLALAAVLVLPAIPATVLQIGAGLAFGPPLGLVYVLVADALGASIGFWLARRGRSLIERRLSEENRATLARLSQRISWRSMLLLRLLPGPAYPLVSFAAGYSPIGFLPYTLSSLLGVLPSLALLVLAGDLVTNSPFLAFGLVVLLVGGLAFAGRLIQQDP